MSVNPGFMRKIASNYILLPGFPLVKNGYVVLSGAAVVDVVNTGGEMKEIAGLEFYGGMIVAGYVTGQVLEQAGNDSFLPVIEELYLEKGSDYAGLSIIEGADLSSFLIRGSMVVRHLV